MKPPRLPPEHEDRLVDCREQMEAAFVEFVDRACAIGWNRKEVIMSLGHLSLSHLDALTANDDTERKIAEMMERYKSGPPGTKH